MLGDCKALRRFRASQVKRARKGVASRPERGMDTLGRLRTKTNLVLVIVLVSQISTRKSLIIREVEARGVEPLS